MGTKRDIKYKYYYDNQREWKRTGSQVPTETAIKAPFTFFYLTDNVWSTNYNYDFWNINFTNAANVDNTAIIKTIYDPSISAFTLPKTAAFTNFTSTGAEVSNANLYNVDGGMVSGFYFYTKEWRKGETIFWHAFGTRDIWSGRSGTGNVTGFATEGHYWVAGAASSITGRALHFNINRICPQYTNGRSYGNVLWLVKE